MLTPHERFRKSEKISAHYKAPGHAQRDNGENNN